MPNSTAVDAAFALGAQLNHSCPIEGNGDLYGLGIRIGLYLQIFTAQISGLASHVLEVDDNIGHAVVVFILATGTVLFRLILQQRIEAVEVFPILSLLVVQLGACRVPFWKKPMTVAIYLGEVVCLLSLTTWFWFHGMDTLPRSCRDDYAFFFKKVSIWHWFRKFSQAGTVLAVIGGGGGVLVYLLSEFLSLGVAVGGSMANKTKCCPPWCTPISHNGLAAGEIGRTDAKKENTQTWAPALSKLPSSWASSCM
jgi:hypothetical protein